MEATIGAEVSSKIRAAIKAKLMELGAYVDDELPDYVMVMVANKRTRQQMDEELNLFLGSNTGDFTSWLHQVLQKLHEVTVAGMVFDVKKLMQSTSASEMTHSPPGTKRKSVSVDSEGGQNQQQQSCTKVAIVHSDDEDDEDFINIKADAEAEALLKAELPKDALDPGANILEHTLDKQLVEDIRRAPFSDISVSNRLTDTVEESVPKKHVDTKDWVASKRNSESVERTASKKYLDAKEWGTAKRHCEIDNRNTSKRHAESEDRSSYKRQSDGDDNVPAKRHLDDRSMSKRHSEIEARPTLKRHSEIEEKNVSSRSNAECKDRGISKLHVESQNKLTPRKHSEIIGKHSSKRHSEMESKNSSKRHFDSTTSERPSEEEMSPSKRHIVVDAIEIQNLDSDLKIVAHTQFEPDKRDTSERKTETEVRIVPKKHLTVSSVSVKDRLGLKRPILNRHYHTQESKDRGRTRIVDRLGYHTIPSTVSIKRWKKEESKQRPENRIGHKSVQDNMDDEKQPVKDRIGHKAILDSRNGERQDVPNNLGYSIVSVKQIRVIDRLGRKIVAASRDDEKPRISDRIACKTIPESTVDEKLKVDMPVQKEVSPEPCTGSPEETSSDSSSLSPKKVMSRVVPLVVPSVKTEDEERCNPTGSVASVVRVKPRPKIAPALQANCNLILKAMAEAQKSVANVPVRPEPVSRSKSSKRPDSMLTRHYRGGKIVAITLPSHRMEFQREVSSRDRDESPAVERLVVPVKIETSRSISSVNLQQKIVVRVSSEPTSKMSPSQSHLSESTSRPVLDVQEDVLHDCLEKSEEPNEQTKKEQTRTKQLYSESRFRSDSPQYNQETPKLRSHSPQFLVTLDGLDRSTFQNVSLEGEKDDLSKHPNSFKRSELDLSTDTIEHTNMEVCKFWPACRLGDKCIYQHPSIQSKSIPNYKFGEKCIIVHPHCKFDAACTRKDCPYTHKCPRISATGLPLERWKFSSHKTSQMMCKFYPNCSNSSCHFLHPKFCRYGRNCSKKGCMFVHEELPATDKLKWTRSYRGK